MKHLYAPWRSAYTAGKKKDAGCVLCNKHTEQLDQKNFIIKRYEHCYVMLNLFPYNAGHLLVIPYEHCDALENLPAQTRQEIMEVTAKSTAILKQTLQAEGINIGINLGGPAAGGSIPEHLHVHILPRWSSDTNFLVTLAETKQISVDLPGVYRKLIAADW